MSIRITVLSFLVLGLSIYAWRNWFRALCGAMVIMAFTEHHDMPRHIFGIEGFNLWNLLMLNVLGGWLSWRNATGVTTDMPRRLRWAFILYGIVIVWAFLRCFADPTRYYEFSRSAMTVEFLINPLKFLIPCFLFYSGCRTRENVIWALGAIVIMYLFLSLQVVRYMGLHLDFSGAALARRAAKVINNSLGYNRVDMSMMLAGASWAVVAFSSIFQKRMFRLLSWGAAGFVLFAQAMTGGRTGYITWGVLGLFLCVIKWRRLLPLIPVAAAIIILVLPGVRERMLEGFGGREGNYVQQTNDSEITSGRSVMWPYVIDKIKEAPLFGYGRLAMIRTGLSDEVSEELHDTFAHPHNAYLEMLLDNGILGFLCVLPLYYMILRRSISLFVDRGDITFEVAGGVALSLLLALLIAGTGAQTLYPREGVIGMWAAIGVALRVWVERERLHASGENRWTTSAEGEQASGDEFIFDREEAIPAGRSGAVHSAPVSINLVGGQMGVGEKG